MGSGGGESFDYLYDVPVEKIDLTFDKPYMFIVRNKETGEVWFVGTVYKPLSAKEEKIEEKNSESIYNQFRYSNYFKGIK